jgi:hypothetical protein
MSTVMILTRAQHYIAAGRDDAANSSALADLLHQTRTALSNSRPLESSTSATAPAASTSATPLVKELEIDEIIRFCLAHRAAASQCAGLGELERRLRDGTELHAVRIAAELRSANAFRAVLALFRAPDAASATLLAAARLLAAAAAVDGATRERLRYVGAVPALLAKCCLPGELSSSLTPAPNGDESSADSAVVVDPGELERVTLACLRALLALTADANARTAVRRADGLARLVRLLAGDTPKPLQLVASAVLAAVTADGSGADEMPVDAVADTVIMLLQRADDERIVTQALKLILNVSRSSSLAQRIVAAADGRTRRALLHLFEKFLGRDQLYAALVAGAETAARTLQYLKETQTCLLAALAGFASNEALCKFLLPVVPRVALFLRAPPQSTFDTFAWDSQTLAATLGVVQMLCVSDASRAVLLEDGATRGALVALVDTPRLFAPAIAAAAASCLQALWQMQPDAKLDPREARAVLSLLRRTDRHADAVQTAVQTLNAMAGGGEAALVPLLALGGVELLHGLVTDTHEPDSALSALDVRAEAARALRRLARAPAARVAIVALAPVGSLATLPLDVDGTPAAARFAAVVAQLVAQLVRDAATARTLLDDSAALGVLIARVTCKHAQLRRASLAALAVLARHSIAELIKWGIIDQLLSFVALGGDDAASDSSASEKQVAMQLLAAAASTPDGEVLLSSDERRNSLRTIASNVKSQSGTVGGMARNILSAVSLRAIVAANAPAATAVHAQLSSLYLRCEASDGRIVMVDVPSIDAATKQWLNGELAALLQLPQCDLPLTYLPNQGSSRLLASDADVRACLQEAATAPSRTARVLVETTPFDSGIGNDTVQRILDKLSREDLIALLGVAARIGHVLVKDALVAWRAGATGEPSGATGSASSTPVKAVPPPPSSGPPPSKRAAAPPPPPPAPGGAAPPVPRTKAPLPPPTAETSDSESSEIVVEEDHEAELVPDAAALELLEMFDGAALRFQEQSIAMQLEEAHAAGESMLSAAAIPLEEQPDSIAAMQLDTLQYDLAEATNRVLECAQVVLEDPDDEDAVEQFTASLGEAQQTIVAVRRVLAPWEYAADEARTDAAYPGQFRVTAADIRKVKLRDKSLRLTTAVASNDDVDVGGDDENGGDSGGNGGGTANMKLLAELRVAVKGGMQLRKVEPRSAAERESTRELSAAELLMRDLTANVNARRTVARDRRILLDQDTQLGKRYFTDVPRWVEAIDPLLGDRVRGRPLLELLLTLLEMRDSELPWNEAAQGFENDERWLSNALRTIGFSLKRRVYASQTNESGNIADDERIIEYEAVVRQASLPLHMLARCLLVVAGGVEVATPIKSPSVTARGSPQSPASPASPASPLVRRVSHSHASPAATVAAANRSSDALARRSSTSRTDEPPDWSRAQVATRRESGGGNGGGGGFLGAQRGSAARRSAHDSSSANNLLAGSSSGSGVAPRSLLGRHRGDSDAGFRPATAAPTVGSAPLPPLPEVPADDDEPPPEPMSRAPGSSLPSTPAVVMLAANGRSASKGSAALLDDYM